MNARVNRWVQNLDEWIDAHGFGNEPSTVNAAQLAKACGVAYHTVTIWRKTGRIHGCGKDRQAFLFDPKEVLAMLRIEPQRTPEPALPAPYFPPPPEVVPEIQIKRRVNTCAGNRLRER